MLKRRRVVELVGCAVFPWLAVCSDQKQLPEDPPKIRTVAVARIDDESLRKSDQRWADWLMHGRTYGEQRFSPLQQINAGTIGQLGLAWVHDTETKRGLEATPLVVDGILFATGPWSVVLAVDARTGELLWKYDPAVPKKYGALACCDVVNRGVAIYSGKIYAGVLDGRLVALDSETGDVVWETVTVDQGLPYTITGAPRVVKGRVVIGNSGAEYGVRGYVSAYEADTGELAWRTYTVPGDPAKPFESEALQRAAKTWKGQDWWKMGGGGTVGDSFAYDPELDLLYVGTGSGSPWNRRIRSPGGGDNLYVAAVLALRPDSGRLVWHYQTTPGDTWGYAATQHMILADLVWEQQPRKVLMQAPKNGFFYVLDRATGELLSAKPYITVTWALGVDQDTGRPIEARGNRYGRGPALIKPTSLGGHNWQPMSFNPDMGLVYIPAHDVASIYSEEDNFSYQPGTWNTGVDFGMVRDLPPALASGVLLAWDPVEQQVRWRVRHPSPWNGGTLTTAGNLVFQGTADGRLVAYRADNGEQVWETWAGTGILAAPVTYMVDGQQYVSVMAGWGGAFALSGGEAAAASQVGGVGSLLSFTLGGKKSVSVQRPDPLPALASVALDASSAQIEEGARLYARWCVRCHGMGAVGGGAISDLRHSSRETFEGYPEIVLNGALEEAGMPSFERWLGLQEVEAIRSYVLKRLSEIESRK